MCGIAGHIAFGRQPDVDALRAMTGRIAHRGPDHQAVWHRDEAALGHARLSVIDLSKANNQPMVDPLTGNVIVFNGEIYNFKSLRASLEKKGERFSTQGDTEVVLGLYRCHGINFLSMLRGMFAFALWDPTNRMLFMARDPLGKKPLAYAQTGQGFVFASEVGALAKHPLVSREMDCEALTHYLSLSYIPSPFSIYQSIRKLPPGHFAIYDAEGLRMDRYFELDYREKDSIGLEEAVDLVHEELRQAVRLRLISDVPLGAMLSGGLDSSLIAAIMAEQSDGPVKTFSVGFEDRKYNELPHAREVADHLGLVHHEETARPDATGQPAPHCRALRGTLCGQFGLAVVSSQRHGAQPRDRCPERRRRGRAFRWVQPLPAQGAGQHGATRCPFRQVRARRGHRGSARG